MPLSAVKPSQYHQLLDQKAAKTLDLLAQFDPPAAELFPSTPERYRMRAEFRMWHDGDQLNYVMFRKDDPRTPVPIIEFPIACSAIQALMPQLLDRLTHQAILRERLFQLEFLSTLAGDTLITLIYHRKLDDEWHAAAEALSKSLKIEVIGRSRKQKRVIDRDYVEERFEISGRAYFYRQYEQAFTQPNAKLNISMIAWACQCGASIGGDLLELYCGNGNFTLPMSRHFDRVIATEMSKTSIRAARENTLANAIQNIEVIRLSAQEVTQAMNGEREFRRLADLFQPLETYCLNTVFVDPPRAGLDPATEKMVADFDNIIYISCNPETLAENLATLCTTHKIVRFALFDQFPYTHHMECGVFLVRKV
jgi:tRNA (uracil-5-)-methyltransferase